MLLTEDDKDMRAKLGAGFVVEASVGEGEAMMMLLRNVAGIYVRRSIIGESYYQMISNG